MRDETTPKGRWEFGDDVAACFDDMLRRSIPQYDVMRETCVALAAEFQQDGTDIVDLGCSRGDALAPLVEKFGAYNRFVGVEVSQPMLAVARERFAGLIERGVVDIRDLDLREAYPPVRASVTLSVLTLQFTPIEYRQQILRNAATHTVPGGAMILVEKVMGETADTDDLLVRQYYELKAKHGYSYDQILAKRRSLEGVLVPVQAKWNEELLRKAGFDQVDCFWRWMNFAGWVALRGTLSEHDRRRRVP